MKKFLFVIKMALIASLLAGLVAVSGCGESSDPRAFFVFYINEDNSELVPKEYTLYSTELEDQIQELLMVLSQDTGRVDHVKPIQDDLKIIKYEMADGYLTLHFNSAYRDLDNVTEVLLRSAVVKTLVQLEGINGIWFYVDGAQLSDSKGNYIGLMNANSFVDTPGEDIQNIQEAELTLYFASQDGKGLVKTVQKVYSSSNVSMEKMIIEQLLKDPKAENVQSAIPQGTQLINISVLDGVCVVNFDSNFMTHNFEIAEEVVIYSIVDSLTELTTIQTVQIAVDGETNKVYREKYSLSEQYQRDLSLVIDVNDTVEVVDEAPDKGGVLNNITE